MASSWSLLLFFALGSLLLAVYSGDSERVLIDSVEQHSILEPRLPIQYKNKKRSEVYLPPLPEIENFVRPVTEVDSTHERSCSHHPGKSVTLHKRQAKCTWGFRPDFPCENPETRARYANSLSYASTPTITLKYNLVILHADDGSDPTASDEQIRLQHAVLNDAYRAVKVQFVYSIQRVFSSALRYRVVLRDVCTRAQVEDNSTTAGCVSPFTGYDGGNAICNNTNCNPSCSSYLDLKQRPSACPCLCVPEIFSCSASQVGNGFCNPECNFAKFNWDGGDCCPRPGSSPSSINKNFTCRDPANSLRNWYDSSDLYFFLNLDSANQINVVVAPGDANSEQGWGVGPNDDKFFTREGGVFLNSRLNAFGVYVAEGKTGLTFVHMMGHVLGLLDVHVGSDTLLMSEGSKSAVCKHPCYEEQPTLSQQGSSSTGDLINDTRPTSYNTQCRDPLRCGADRTSFCSDCQDSDWFSTPFNNYMSGSGDSCPKSFTLQQRGRLYCYADQFLRSYWQGASAAPTTAPPTPQPNAPVATEAHNSILVDWSNVLPNYFGSNTKLSAGDFSWLVQREPAFSRTVQVAGDHYLDKEVMPKTMYRYRVQMILENNMLSSWSPWSNSVALAKVCTCRRYNLGNLAKADLMRKCEVCGTGGAHANPVLA